MQKSETLISYEGVKQSFEGNITIFGGRLLGGMRVSLKALQIYVNGVRSKIEALPRVEIVRCEHCKNKEQIEHDGALEYWCDIVDGFVTSDDYCSWGEPKEGNHERAD